MNGNLEAADELIHPDFVDHEPAHPGQPTGPESVKQTVRRLHDDFGRLRFDVQHEIAEGDKVVQLVIMSGRHTDSLGDRGRSGWPGRRLRRCATRDARGVRQTAAERAWAPKRVL